MGGLGKEGRGLRDVRTVNPEPRVAGYIRVNVGWVSMCTPFPGYMRRLKGVKQKILNAVQRTVGFILHIQEVDSQRALVLLSTILKRYPNHVI